MIIDLDDINGRSLMNVFFDTKEEPLTYDDLDYMNLVFSGNGVFLVLKSRFGITYERTSQVYKNLSLREYEFDWAFNPQLPKAPKELFVDILECFKYIVGKTKDELFIILYYDTKEEKYLMDIVKLQIISGGAVKYAYNKKYEMEDRYIKYLEIHSHNTMGASFSGTDNNDESGRTMYFCGVIGKIDQHSNIYNVDQKFRIWTGQKFRDIKPWEVFDIYMPTPSIKDAHKVRLDQILAISKAAKERSKITANKNIGIPGLFDRNKNNPGTILLPSSGREVEVIRDHMNVFDYNPLGEEFPTLDELNEMDEEELANLGIMWEPYDDEEKEQINELIGEKRGDGTPLN